MLEPQAATDGLDETARLKEYLVQLARLSLTGRPQDVQAYIARIARRLRTEGPDVAEALGTLIREVPSLASPLRGGAVASIPVDQESRLSLVRVETVPILTADPVWSENIRRQLEALIRERRHVPELARAGLSASRTGLFIGPPGVGKTLAARWIADQLSWPLMLLDLAAVMSSFLGKTGLNLRHVLDYAKGVPCVLLLDEIDALAKRRDDQTEIGELKRLVTVLLQQIDDWPSTSLLLATTNHPDLLDPALWRRFDAVVRFDLPTSAQVHEFVRRELSDSDVSDGLLAALTVVFTGDSFSEIDTSLQALRRHAIVHQRAGDEIALEIVRRHANALSKPAKVNLARALMAAGVSQRQSHDITGIARDTIRRVTSGGNGER